MAKLVNRAKMTTATTGTGTITLGSASTGYQSFADAGVSDGDVVSYVITDGANWEIGRGTYTASGTTLSRTVLESTNSDAAINLSGSAVVFVSAIAADVIKDIGASAYRSTNQSIAHNTATVIAFDSENWDTDSIHSTSTNTSRLTATKAGRYVVAGSVYWDSNANGYRQIEIIKNGTTSLGVLMHPATSGNAMALSIVCALAVSDYVELKVYQNSSSSLNVLYISAFLPALTMQLIEVTA